MEQSGESAYRGVALPGAGRESLSDRDSRQVGGIPWPRRNCAAQPCETF